MNIIRYLQQAMEMVKGISSNPGFMQPEHLSYTKEIPIKSKSRPVPYLQKISQVFSKILKKWTPLFFQDYGLCDLQTKYQLEDFLP